MLAVGKPPNDLCRCLFPGELAEELFEVLNLEGALLERVLLDQVLHGHGQGFGSASVVSAPSSICQSARGCGPGVMPARSGSSPRGRGPSLDRRSFVSWRRCSFWRWRSIRAFSRSRFCSVGRDRLAMLHSLRRRRTRARTGATPCGDHPAIARDSVRKLRATGPRAPLATQDVEVWPLRTGRVDGYPAIVASATR